MKHIDTMLSVFQRHSCICQVIIWTPEGPISYASESLIVIFLPWYNCYVYVLNGNKMFLNWIELNTYRQVSNIRCTLVVGNQIDDHSDVVGAPPVGAAPTTSSFLT